MTETKQIFEIIRSNFERWTAAWNAGDLDSYLMCYVPSEQTRYISGGHMLLGFDQIAESYKMRFVTGQGMGQLELLDLQPQIITLTDALVFGEWNLRRVDGEYHGVFHVHLKKIGDDWLIVTDHASSLTD